jgi:oxygen-dependent protoporphyrinogen oxidase
VLREFDRQQLRVAVVGSGISGLAAAVNLERAGFSVEIIERDRQLGGRFGMAMLGDRPVMVGGKNIGLRYSAFRSVMAALGDYRYHTFGINTSRLKDGEVLALDSSRRGHSLANVWRMGKPRDFARLGMLAARIRADDRNKFLGSEYFTGLSRKYDHQPLSAHFGPEITRYLLRAMTVRMNGAEPDEVYLGTFGTNLALMLDTYEQLDQGVQPAMEAVARRIPVRLGTEVKGLVSAGGKVVGLRLSEQGGPETASHYDGVVIATPAWATGGILAADHPELGRRLGDVRYFPSTVALVQYDRPVFNPQIRALAMDEGPCSNAGAYGMEDRHIVRYTFSGRQGRRVQPTEEQLKDWIGETEERLIRYLGVGRAKREVTLVHHWDRAYSAYLPYHGEFLDDVRRAVAQLPGLVLAGDYLRGVSLEACSRSGLAAAEQLIAYLDRPDLAA